MPSINELRAAIAAKRAEYQAKVDTATMRQLRAITEEVKSLSDSLNAAIVEGAEPCESCELLPMGLVQQVDVKGEPQDYFEIGCSGPCQHKRAQGFTREQAVQKWNDEKYLKPKAR